MVAFRYSEWDGKQEIPPLDPDELLESITDDLMNFGDLQHALRNLLQRGMRNPMGQRMDGLRDLLQQLRQKRRSTLDQFNLSSVFEDIERRLEEVLDMERATLDKRMHDAMQQQGEPESGERPSGSPEGLPEGSQAPDQGAEGSEQPSGTPQQGQQGEGGQQGQQGEGGQPRAGEGAASEGPTGDEAEFAKMLSSITERKRQFLEGLPEDVPGKIKELQNYEFMDPEAQHRYQELMEMLKQAMTETFFKDIQQQISNMSPEDMARMKQMVEDLNQMLSDKMAGDEPNFKEFMEKYGDLFGPNPPESLEELIAQIAKSTSPSVRTLLPR